MNAIHYCLAAAAAAIAASPLSAQAVTLTANWPSQSQITTSIGPQSQALSVGAGPINLSSARTQEVFLPAGQARSEVGWSTYLPLFDDRIEFRYQVSGEVWSAGAASATVEEHDVLLTLQAPAVRQILLFAEVDAEVTANGAAPRMDVDIGDDGTIDFSTTQTAGFLSMPVGPVALPIRITCGGEASTPGIFNPSFLAKLLLRIEPDNRILQARVATGCANILLANQAFAHSGIRLEVPYTFNPVIGVLGLGAHPLLLPASAPPLPCLLIPRPDLLVLVSNSAGFNLPIPAAARPIDIYVQGIELVAANELWSTDAILFAAY